MVEWISRVAGTRKSLALRDHLIAGSICLPALIAVVQLSNPPPFEVLLFSVGGPVCLYNLSVVVIVPYLICFLLALGEFFLPGKSSDSPETLSRADDVLVGFFGGVSLLIVFGFVLGLLGALRAALTAPIFFLVLYLYFLKHSRYLRDGINAARDWILVRDLASQDASEPAARMLVTTAILRASILLVTALVVMVKGAFIDIHISDIVQLYLPYLEEVRRQHGTWLDPVHPVYSDFLVGRGNGAHLFLTSFTNAYVTQAVSVTYMLVTALLVRQVVMRILSPKGYSELGTISVRLVPGVVTLLSLSVFLNSELTLAKYHMQTTALTLGLLYILFLVDDNARDGRRATALVFVAVAIPTTLPQYQALSSFVLAIGAVVIAHRSWAKTGTMLGLVSMLRFLAALFVIGCLACAGGLLFNWFHIGIPELNPYWIFAGFVRPDVFSRWASHDALVYTAYIQHLYPGFDDARKSLAAISSSAAEDQIAHFVAAAITGGILGIAFLLLTDPGEKRKFGGSAFRICLMDGSRLLVVAALIIFFVKGVPPKWVRLLVHVLLSYIAAGAVTILLLGAIARPKEMALEFVKRLPVDGLCFAAVLGAMVVASQQLGYLSFARLTEYMYVLAPLTIFLLVIVVWWLIARAWTAVLSVQVSSIRGTAVVTAFEWAGVLVFLGCLLGFLLISNLGLGVTLRMTMAHLLALIVGAVAIGHFVLRKRYELASFQSIGSRALVAVLQVVVIASVLFVGQKASKSKALSSVPYVTGLKARVAAIKDPNWSFRRCLELREAVPGDSKVLHLNGYYRMSQCLFNPLLPRDKLVHHYESSFARRFGEIVFGTAEDAEAELKKLGINYFLVDKGDISFWGAGLSELFSRENLTQRFQVFYESPRFIVLTWLGEGRHEMPEKLADDIERWRELIRARAGKPLSPEFPFDFWGALKLMREERLGSRSDPR